MAAKLGAGLGELDPAVAADADDTTASATTPVRSRTAGEVRLSLPREGVGIVGSDRTADGMPRSVQIPCHHLRTEKLSRYRAGMTRRQMLPGRNVPTPPREDRDPRRSRDARAGTLPAIR